MLNIRIMASNDSKQQLMISNGNVLLIDPNLVNTNINMINSIPQYQDMYISAELTAERKGRTVIEIKGNTVGLAQTGLENTVTVNFIGNNQDSSNSNPNYLNFTTNWYDGSTGNGIEYEGFGISSIKVIVNSSFVPQINIQFIDLRGLAFFNQENSPYRILFDFPPPIFTLTIKGYYGMPLKYQLHLVKYTSEFKAENGNFIIDAQFIAMTFAPLTDVLFRYVVNFPLIDEGINANPNPTSPPNNTNELILKIKNLITATNSDKSSSNTTQKYDSLLNQINNNTSMIEVINSFAENEILKPFNPILLIKDTEITESNVNELNIINNTLSYDSYIKGISTTGIPTVLSKRLFIAALISQKIPFSAATQNTANNERLVQALVQFDSYGKKIIADTIAVMGNVVVNNDIPTSSKFINNPNNSTDTTTTNLYVYIDITDYYMKLYKQRVELDNSKTDEMKVINEKINDLVLQTLGMKPTIYNIFKILLNDVDKFFGKLRTTSKLAEEHHNTYKNQIISDTTYNDTGKNDNIDNAHIFSFPLVTKQGSGCDKSITRTVPIDLSNLLPEPFPEIDLIQQFIETFYLQQKITEQLNLKSEQNADGTNKWIPIAPVDSSLASIDIASPYFGVDTSNGGSESQPINLSGDNRLNQILGIIIKRFYILTQNSYANIFYYLDKGSTALVELYSQSEAVNLSSSITNIKYTQLLSTIGNLYGTQGKIQDFYDYVKNNLPELFEFTRENKPYFQISTNGENLYTNKFNPDYVGFKMYSEPISIQTFDETANNPISNYQKTVESKWYEFYKKDAPQSFYGFTNENVFYVNDENTEGSGNNSNGISSESRFLANTITFKTTEGTNQDIKIYSDYGNGIMGTIQDVYSYLGGPETYIIENKKSFISNASEYGNFNFEKAGIGSTPITNELKLFGNIVDIWVDQLSKFDTQIKTILLNKSKLNAILILSNFGFALSPFNIYPHKLNEYIFNTATAVEMPSFLPAYIGALVDIVPNSQEYKDIYNFFVNGPGKNLSSSGCMIFSDICDINRFLSIKDKEAFKLIYESFFSNDLDAILIGINNIYSAAETEAAKVSLIKDKIKAKIKYYESTLNASTGDEFKNILQPLIKRTTLINYSPITFRMELVYFPGYESIGSINNNATSTNEAMRNLYVPRKSINDNYFIKLFTSLKSNILAKESELKKQETEYSKLRTDPDIMTQTYYSFKNINDKWLTGPNSIETGYPFNQPGGSGPLIDSFAFVDRAMNPIGDTILNPEMLVQMFDDQNISIYTVLTQLLSANGFEFFPIQNFMSYQNKDWENSFKIDTSGNITSTPAFVCMYIGGSSSYPSNIYLYNQFEDDGILDISNSGAPDFSTISGGTYNNCFPVPDDDGQIDRNNNKSEDKKFKYGQVRAFRVRFGEQNQSMFSNIKIDSKEYPETNESIQILSRIAGDNKNQAPPPKGQNLYNTYANRAYKATITGLGNAMIQPTQYFQLENIPMFNGAYLILSVEHNIEPNKMTTSFSGTKILKYPIPRVKDSSAITGFDGGNTDKTNPALSSANDVRLGSGVAGNPRQTQYNSMYDFKIQ
jgi:hypothetical protein